jgi:hypothetical protein
MALSGPAAQALLGQLGKAGVMSSAANVGGQAMQFAGRMVPYLPAIGQFFGGDALGGVVTAGAAKLAPKGSKTAVGLATSLLAPPILGATASGAQQLVSALTGSRREEGKSGLTGVGVGFSDEDVKRIEELSRITGQSQVDIARQLLPIQQQFRDAEMQRTMQLNQQTAQLTGALNRQLYTAQLAGGAQQQAGETTRTMMTAANPYAQSAFSYRG